MSESLIEVEGVDYRKLALWMDGVGLAPGPIENAELLTGGTQNILLRFERGGVEYVLRRPPVHKRANSDETLRREARVLAALAGSDVPHPTLLGACSDVDVLGGAFILMESIHGFNPGNGLPELHASDPKIRHEMGLEMVDAIAALGSLDYKAVGLEGFGKPEGYLERQVPRWRAQLESYDQLDGYPGPQIPGVEEVGAWLEEHRPSNWKPGIIHGDFHFLNVLFDNESSKLAAVVDWELSTIGDPLLDLGWLLATWPQKVEGGTPVTQVQPFDGFPKPDELVARYGERSDRDVSAIGWYEVLACYKLGIILEGTYARACAGKASKDTGDVLHRSTLGLFERAHTRMSGA